MSDADFQISHHLLRFVISNFERKILHFIASLGLMVTQKKYKALKNASHSSLSQIWDIENAMSKIFGSVFARDGAV